MRKDSNAQPADEEKMGVAFTMGGQLLKKSGISYDERLTIRPLLKGKTGKRGPSKGDLA